MTDDEALLRKRIMLEDFAAAKLNLQTWQDLARKEAQGLEDVVQYLKHGGECGQITALSVLAEHLSRKLPALIQALEDACDEKGMLQRMLSDIGIVPDGA
jgi:hypothetical protein